MVVLAGPAGNFILAVTCANLYHRLSESISKKMIWVSAVVNVQLGIANILPLGFFDGGKIAYKLLSMVFDQGMANEIVPFLSMLSLLLLIRFGIPSEKIEGYLGL